MAELARVKFTRVQNAPQGYQPASSGKVVDITRSQGNVATKRGLSDDGAMPPLTGDSGET